MTVTNRLDFDALTAGSPYTATAPWSTNGQIPTIETASADHGANGLHYPDTGTSGRVMYDFGTNQTGTIVLSSYFRIVTFSTVNQYINSVYSLTSGGTLQGDWRINSARTVTIRNGSTAAATGPAVLSSGTWYRSEWRINATDDTQELRIYVGEDTNSIINIAGAWTSSTTRVFAFGPNVAAAGGVIDYDTVKVADDWTGPENPASTPTATLTVRRYNAATNVWE